MVTLMKKHLGRLQIIITFAVLLLIVGILLLMVFYAGKKTYVVKFDLNGGTLISGSLEQHVTQGQDAYPPNVFKNGAYLHSWSRSYTRVTQDLVITAIWEYETTTGIAYSSGEDQNYAEIESAFKYLNGDVYLGAYHDGKKILGICSEAFSGCEGITNVYLLDGLIAIGDEAFSGCISLLGMDIPKTVTHLGNGVFRGCESLESITLHEGLLKIGAGVFENCTSLSEAEIPKTVKSIGAGAFRGCDSLTKVVIPSGIEEIGAGAFEGCTGLTEIIIPFSVKKIGADAFAGCDNLKITVNVKEPLDGWEEGWSGNAEVEYVTFKPIFRPDYPFKPPKDDEAEDDGIKIPNDIIPDFKDPNEESADGADPDENPFEGKQPHDLRRPALFKINSAIITPLKEPGARP